MDLERVSRAGIYFGSVCSSSACPPKVLQSVPTRSAQRMLDVAILGAATFAGVMSNAVYDRVVRGKFAGNILRRRDVVSGVDRRPDCNAAYLSNTPDRIRCCHSGSHVLSERIFL